MNPGTYVYDAGTIYITVNGHSDGYNFGQNDTTSTIASGLARSINSDGGASVTASASGATVYLTSKSTGSTANMSLGSSYSYDATDFSHSSFTTANSGSSLTGGRNAAYQTIYDSGTATLTVAGEGDNDSWSGSGTTAASIASALATAINSDSKASVTASASGGTVSLAAKSAGAAGNYSVSCSMSYNSSQFSSASFALGCPAAMTGGKDAIYDAGTATITVNSHTNAVSFASGATPASIATALAANINADSGASVTATASSATVNLTATTKGTISNYPMSAAVTYDSSHFSKASFTAATSGSTLTGGWPNPQAVDSGTMTVTVNSTQYQVTWGTNSTPGSIAQALVLTLGGDATVVPTLAGNVVYLDPKIAGASYNFSTAYTYDTTDFKQSSFAPANSISDYGTAAITVNGHSDSVAWAGHDTANTIAGNLSSHISSDSAASVNATASSGTVALTARTKGAATNYTLASVVAYNTANFSSASFSASNSGTALAGGVDAVYKTVYDAGTVWIEVNGFQVTAAYQQGSTASSIAGALAGQLNASGSPVSAVVSGSVLTLTATQPGSISNYSLSSGVTSSQSGTFAQPSFSASLSGDKLTGGSDSAPSFTSSTLYAYDALGDLVGVTQGSQTRSYTYDSLGRQTAATTPESGTVSTFYTDAKSNACAGDPTLPCQVQDARSTTKTFTYDAINRVTGVTYSDSTPSVTYQYDSGGSSAFALDRLTKITDGANSHTFSYDNFGRVTKDSQVIDGTTYSIQYAYNLAGQMTSITYPTGRVVTQNLDGLGRLTSVSDTTVTYLNNLNYNAAGEALGLTLGNGVQGTFGYNDHLQLAALRYFLPGAAQDILNLEYDYSAQNNGQIASVRYFTAPGIEDTTRSEYFSYDLLGRLATAHTGDVSASATATPTWALNWSYDRWGNRLSQTLTGGSATAGQPQLTVDPNTNRITNNGITYDAAGNMTNDGVNAYTFDGTNRVTQLGSNTAAYTYFGPLRIKKVIGSNTTTYIYSGNKPLVEYENGAVSKEYIYAGSTLVATVAGNSVTYHHPDHLSNRAETDAIGNVTRSFGHLPFGDSWYETGTTDKWKFTSYERDGESGTDYAHFRQYSSGLGRFMSADSFNSTTQNPQSLNRYIYTGNDPVNLVDPLGLFAVTTCATPFVTVEYDDGSSLTFQGEPVCTTEDFGDDFGFGNDDFEGFGGGGGGAADINKLRATAIRILLNNADCQNLFGGLSNALAGILNTQFLNYSPGMDKPDGLGPGNWAKLQSDLQDPRFTIPAASFFDPPPNPIGGTTLFFSAFNNLGSAGPWETQQNVFFHELEHQALQKNDMQLGTDTRQGAAGDLQNIDKKCQPKDIPTETAPPTLLPEVQP